MKSRARFWLLGIATLWAIIWVGIAFFHHFAEPVGVTSISTNGNTYYGDPPALSLYERDPFSMNLAFCVVGVALAFAYAEASVLWSRQLTDRAPIATTVGVLVVLYSLFGLFWGLLSVGLVGVLIFLSGSPDRSASNIPVEPSI